MAMRDDMFKVIVERPRRGGSMDGGTARAYRNSEEAPAKIGIKKGYTHRKWLNENLAPLKRWLESQANRPWDKVYAEQCANIDRRNTVQEHIFAHIDSFVERETRWLDGEVFVMQRWPHALVPVRESRATLYVHPSTGILGVNKHRVSNRKQKELTRLAEEKMRAATCRVLSDHADLRKIEGVWYHVTMAPMALPQATGGADGRPVTWVYPQHWDVLKRQMVSLPRHAAFERAQTRSAFVREYRYATAKRQLTHAELKRHQLSNDANDNAGNARRFLWRLPMRRVLTATR
jgi:hypothetical protein